MLKYNYNLIYGIPFTIIVIDAHVIIVVLKFKLKYIKYINKSTTGAHTLTLTLPCFKTSYQFLNFFQLSVMLLPLGPNVLLSNSFPLRTSVTFPETKRDKLYFLLYISSYDPGKS